jgi:hypothetical protein
MQARSSPCRHLLAAFCSSSRHPQPLRPQQRQPGTKEFALGSIFLKATTLMIDNPRNNVTGRRKRKD